LLEVARADHDPIALCVKLAGDLPADATVSARNERDALHGAIIAIDAGRARVALPGRPVAELRPPDPLTE